MVALTVEFLCVFLKSAFRLFCYNISWLYWLFGLKLSGSLSQKNWRWLTKIIAKEPFFWKLLLLKDSKNCWKKALVLFSHRNFSKHALQKILVKHFYKDIQEMYWRFKFKNFSRTWDICSSTLINFLVSGPIIMQKLSSFEFF